jgi:NADPH:quinone reductase-like Zn-dependent oxidoreductase
MASRVLPIATFTLSDIAGQGYRAASWLCVPGALYLMVFKGFSVLPAAACALAAFMLTTIVAIALADTDLSLLTRGHGAPDAYLNKTVLIVGASRGVGATLARHLARAGAVLILAARSEGDLQVRVACACLLDAAASQK